MLTGRKMKVWMAGLMLPLLFALSGCGGGGGGGNDKADTPVPVISVTPHADANVTGRHLTIDLWLGDGTSRAVSSIQAKDFKFDISGSGGCVMDPSTLVYTPGVVTVPGILHIEGDFTSAACKPEKYTLRFTQVSKVDGSISERPRYVEGNLFSEPPVPPTPPVPPVDTSNLNLTVVPSELNVSSAGETRTISVYVENNSTHVPAAGTAVRAAFFDPAKGTLNTYEATTNANGQAVFEYTAPDPNPGSGGVTIDFDIVNASVSRKQSVVVGFSSSSVPPVDTSNLNLTVVPSELNVSTAGETRAISVYVEDNATHAPKEGVAVKAAFFDPTKGTLNTYEASTDVNGRALFSYVAPERMPTGDLNITFSIANGTPIRETNVTVNFDHANYNITADANLTVTKANTTQTIQIGLWKQNPDGSNEPAIGKTVVAEFLMPIFGTITSYEAVVDQSGIATFTYRSPSRIADVNDTNITFHYKNDRTIQAQTELLFRPESVDQVETLYIVPDQLTITGGAEKKNITIITVNNNNMGISATVNIEQPDNGTDYGYFTPSGPVTTDTSGRVNVVYTAPDSIGGLAERNITFEVDGTTITKELVIAYNQATGPGIDYMIDVKTPNSFAVDESDQITVVIHEVGNAQNIIDDADVHEVNLTSRFTNLLTFENNAANYTYSDYGSKAVSVESKTLSGTAVIEIKASVFNGDHDVLLQTTVPVVVLSGPVTSMSLFYASTSEDENLSIYKNEYTIHAVDRYNNPARAGITLHPSIINGTKIIRTSSTANSGQITQGNPDTFDDSVVDFTAGNVDINDILMIVPNPNRYGKEYTGTWSIDSVAAHKLGLSEDYLGATTGNLNYVIGNSNRYLPGYGLATVDIKDKEGKGFVTDSNGNVQFVVTFDPVLAGHTVTISATAYDGNRTGVATVAGLRWGSYSSTSVQVKNDGASHVETLTLGISDGREALIDVDIVPSSIKSTSSQCQLDTTSPGTMTNLHTDGNGQITVQISTAGTDSDVKECTIKWSATQGGIYKEY